MTQVADGTVPKASGPGSLDEAGRALLFTEARTANTFAPTPVSDAELTGIWELMKWAPTSSNTQPLRVLYVRPGEARERLVGHMMEGNKEKTATAPAVAVLAVDADFHEFIPKLLPFRPETKDFFAADENFRMDFAKFNGALQVGYFILAVRAHGLAAGPMMGFNAAGVDADFFPDGRWRTLLIVNIGHPGENAWKERLPRLDHEEVVRWA
ncbi:malonic semialdehyde reductase [Streptomyces sp. SID5914]|nr:malonic semialdehyde reductase [Streptomyces sp. SID5914]MZG20008.1 malonic semialdehyde reductase [Streptomyces sp. SID5914]